MFKLATFFALLILLGNCGKSTSEEMQAQSIDRGAKYLQQQYPPNSTFSRDFPLGCSCLTGLALLESGVPSSNEALKKITEFVRANAIGAYRTYEISLAIMYLDRLGEPIDQPAIQLLGIQLLGRQGKDGGWSYSGLHDPTSEDAARIRKAFYEENQLQTPPKEDRPNSPAKKKDAPSAYSGLHPEVVRYARSVEAASRTQPEETAGDNSNTQFAVLALWIARRHGVPCDSALARTDKGQRLAQQANGGWKYDYSRDRSTPSMTCCGLMGIAIGRGAQMQSLRTKSPAQPSPAPIGPALVDRAALAGLKFIESAIANSEKATEMPEGSAEGGKLRDNLYFLWSLERVAMIYDLEKIGNLDWYKWGSEHLIKSQNKDGSWSQTGYDGANAEINTAFALLFLNRANLAKDLTNTLKGKATVKLNLPDQTPQPEPSKLAKVEPKQTPTSIAEFEAQAIRLSNKLVSAGESSRSLVLIELREAKGSVYTEALVRAIAKLDGESRQQARNALAQRLKRMTATTLRDMLKDENKEVRSAAAVACGIKDDKQFVPDLINVLGDADSMVVQSARTSLRNMSGKDFGPNAEARPSDKSQAITAWKAWWATQTDR